MIRTAGCQWGTHVEVETALQQMLLEALDLLNAALDRLDRASAPAQIGAHVDLAIHQLGSIVAIGRDSGEAAPLQRVSAAR